MVAIESRFRRATADALRARGHQVQVGEPGRRAASALPPRATPDGTVLKAAANPRGMQGYAVGR